MNIKTIFFRKFFDTSCKYNYYVKRVELAPDPMSMVGIISSKNIKLLAKENGKIILKRSYFGIKYHIYNIVFTSVLLFRLVLSKGDFE